MCFGRTDAGDDAFAHTGQNGVFAGTAHKLVNVGTHGDAGFGDELDAVFGDGCHGWRVDDLGVDARLHSLEHVAAGEVDGGSLFKGEVDVGLRCRHEGMYHALHVATGHVVCLEVVAGDVVQTGLVRLDEGGHDDVGRHIAQAHQGQLQQRNADARHACRHPQKEGHEMEEHGEGYEGSYGYHNDKAD